MVYAVVLNFHLRSCAPSMFGKLYSSIYSCPPQHYLTRTNKKNVAKALGVLTFSPLGREEA